MDTVKMPGFNYRMSELQAAVGLAQLKKLNYIIKENKKRYKVLENVISKKFKIRKCNKNSSPSYDTFIFEVKDKKTRDKIVKILKLNNIGTKNLPDAIKWHFASFWKHAIGKKEVRKVKACSGQCNTHPQVL